ncbi:armadillo-type protein [Schizophyllum fasciatum]
MTIRPPSVSVSELKKIKNSVIGNPLAKVHLAQDEHFVRTLVHSLNSPPPSPDPQSSQDDMRIEAAHIVASLSYGPDEAVKALIRANALPALLLAIAHFRPDEPTRLRAAFARALRALGVAIADIVGPAIWGLRPEVPEIREEAKEALNMLFQESALDVYAPLLTHPATAPSVAHLLGLAVRTEPHRRALADWRPPADRAQASKSRRGWETSTAAAGAGGWVVRTAAGALSATRDCKMQEAALLCLAALARDNAPVAHALTRGEQPTMAAVLRLTRSKFADVAIAAALCAAFVLRAARAPAAARTVIHAVQRFLAPPPAPAAAKACFVLYYLVADDSALCLLAHERGLVDLALALLEATQPLPAPLPSSHAAPSSSTLSSSLSPDPDPNPDPNPDPDPPARAALREAALTALATLALPAPPVRHALACCAPALARVRAALAAPHAGTRYAACQVVRALARSVAAARTGLVDSGAGEAVFGLLGGVGVGGEGGVGGVGGEGQEEGQGEGQGEGERGEEDRRVRGAALRAVCNLLVEFSPLRKVFLERGLLARLMACLTSGDAALRLGALWAVKNLLHRASVDEVRATMDAVGWERLSGLLTSPDAAIREQAVHILKNITATAPGAALALAAPALAAALPAALGGALGAAPAADDDDGDGALAGLAAGADGVAVHAADVTVHAADVAVHAGGVARHAGGVARHADGALADDGAVHADDIAVHALGALANLAHAHAPAALVAHPVLLARLRACLGERDLPHLPHAQPYPLPSPYPHPHAHAHPYTHPYTHLHPHPHTPYPHPHTPYPHHPEPEGAAVRQAALGAVLALARAGRARRRALLEAGLLGTLQRLVGARAGDVAREEAEQARAAVDWLEHGDYYEERGGG